MRLDPAPRTPARCRRAPSFRKRPRASPPGGRPPRPRCRAEHPSPAMRPTPSSLFHSIVVDAERAGGVAPVDRVDAGHVPRHPPPSARARTAARSTLARSPPPARRARRRSRRTAYSTVQSGWITVAWDRRELVGERADLVLCADELLRQPQVPLSPPDHTGTDRAGRRPRSPRPRRPARASGSSVCRARRGATRVTGRRGNSARSLPQMPPASNRTTTRPGRGSPGSSTFDRLEPPWRDQPVRPHRRRAYRRPPAAIPRPRDATSGMRRFRAV